MVESRERLIWFENRLEIPQEVQPEIEYAAETNLIDEEDVSDLHFVDVSGSKYALSKRILDVLIALMALIAAALPLLILFLIIYIDDPGSVICSQYRVGQGGRCFKLYKLRTMRCHTPKYMSTSEVDDPNKYITRVGRILRRLSLDELPQLINVLKGDMSIVGPRPLISNEYMIHELRTKFGVYAVRPGLTGLAQIHGRDMVTPADKVRWDVRYLEHFGFWSDVKIVLSTIPKLLGGHGFAEGFKHTKV